jgi:hypothetical protein
LRWMTLRPCGVGSLLGATLIFMEDIHRSDLYG